MTVSQSERCRNQPIFKSKQQGIVQHPDGLRENPAEMGWNQAVVRDNSVETIRNPAVFEDNPAEIPKNSAVYLFYPNPISSQARTTDHEPIPQYTCNSFVTPLP